MKHTVLRQFIRLAFCLAIPSFVHGQALDDAFHAPPDATRPWCYWYWINGNVSAEGITKDLEAMARVGIGTALIGNEWFEGQPEGQVKILSEEWWDLTVFAIKEGRRVGVDIGFFNCPGWSQSGGPWIKPPQSMRYLASSETRIRGPAELSTILTAPGKDFQDVAVIALPAPDGENATLRSRKPHISVTPRLDGAEAMVDGNLETAAVVTADGQNTPRTIDITVSSPFTARSISLSPGPGAFRMDVEVQAQVNGRLETMRRFQYDRRNPRPIVGPMPYGQVVASLPAISSNHFRLKLSPTEGTGDLAEIEISPAARVDSFVEKQLGKVHPTPTPLWGDYLWPRSPEPDSKSHIVDPAEVVDLTGRLKPDGHLVWSVPDGNWIVQRIVMMPTGTINAPAEPHAEGLEVDKMSRQHVTTHFDSFVGELLRRIPTEDRPAFKYVVSDSYEVGPQNWTDDMRESFRRAYQYDPVPFLPVLSGRIVGSADASDRFLWDLRRLVANRVAEDYVGELRRLCHQNDLKLWLENYGHWGFPAEFMQYGGQCDLLSGEFWVTGTLGNIECRSAASTSHAYGKKVVYAEAFTSGVNWAYTPIDLKARGDWAFTEGINHFVLHVYVQQPSDDFVPGVYEWFGTDFNRHNTWFEESKDWINYLRRCHLMLQQGVHVADFAYFIGEDAPIMTGARQPMQPAGYDFDFINAEVLLTRMEIRGGRWTLPDGTNYAALVLPPLETMRPELLSRLRELVAAGGVLFGDAPLRSPSLRDHPLCDVQVNLLSEELWQGLPNGRAGEKSYHNGWVIQGESLEPVVRKLKLTADVSGIDPQKLLWTHRQTPDLDIYFLSNQTSETVELAPVFRSVTRRMPELWYADSGKIEVVGQYRNREGGTVVPLTLGPAGSIFVVFRRELQATDFHITATKGPGKVRVIADAEGWQATFEAGGAYELQREGGASIALTVENPPDPIHLNGPWCLTFKPGRDAPAAVEMDMPTLWTEQQSEAIRHFSGTATYRTEFHITGDVLNAGDLRFELDLGHVEPMARVFINGADLGLLWKPPYQIDVTNSLRPGTNVIEVAVTNAWCNRLIGEHKYPAGFPGTETDATFHPRTSTPGNLGPDRPITPSGLRGPVMIKSVGCINLTQQQF